MRMLLILLLVVGSSQALANNVLWKQQQRAKAVSYDRCPLKVASRPELGTLCHTPDREATPEAQQPKAPSFMDSEVARLISQPILKDLK
jgi:hypothetical protein